MIVAQGNDWLQNSSSGRGRPIMKTANRTTKREAKTCMNGQWASNYSIATSPADISGIGFLRFKL